MSVNQLVGVISALRMTDTPGQAAAGIMLMESAKAGERPANATRTMRDRITILFKLAKESHAPIGYHGAIIHLRNRRYQSALFGGSLKMLRTTLLCDDDYGADAAD